MSIAKESRQRAAAPTAPSAYERLEVEKLLFDPRNPRLVDYTDGEDLTQDELLTILWQNMAVDEIAMSIAANGYFSHEPLFVAEEEGNLYVIEGNRRLAAVKLLLNSELRLQLRATDLPKIPPSVAETLRTLPVVPTTREAAWQYLGFKHVNGPATWESYPKAEYIAHVHEDYGIPLEEIARQIGDKHRTVQRLYRALRVIKQAEDAGVWNRNDRYKPHFSFSHLYTGLDYEGIAEFLALRDLSTETRDPVPKRKIQQLGELCRWLYGDKGGALRPLIVSQNPDLRNLDQVLKSKDATLSIRAGSPLDVAMDVGKGDDRVFEESLSQAKIALQKAKGVLSTGFKGEDDLLNLAKIVCDVAFDLVSEMERKKNTRGRGHGRKDFEGV